MAFDLNIIRDFYSRMPELVNLARNQLSRPLTLTEKILYSHLANKSLEDYKRGGSYVNFSPDRVAMQDATAQMALLQFIMTKKNKVFVPTTVHADH